jgi:hypothetical protein
MSTSSPTIPADVAAHVLSHFGRGGYPAGDWTEALITLIDRADMANRAKLLGAFPEYGAAVLLAKYDEEGIATLQRILRGEADTGDSDVPQCPEALFNPNTGILLRCVQRGRHDWHQTPSGSQWNVPVDSSPNVPF